MARPSVAGCPVMAMFLRIVLVWGSDEGTMNAAGAACSDVTCESTSPATCPVDSVLKLSPSAHPECCPPVAECFCDLESCPRRPRCDRGQPSLLSAGLRQPGRCCSTWTCKVNTAVASLCANVTCPAAAAACPADSSRTGAGCCPGQCVCRPEKCPPHGCPAGARPRVAIQGSGRPGACCPVYHCAENSSCVHQGKVYQERASWQLDPCITCHCKDGVSFCDKLECPNLGSCVKVTDPGQCCPRCMDGCLSPSGVHHNSSEEWMEDECTTCSCADSRLHCHVTQCSPACRHPVRVPGLCCPVCDRTECGVVCEHGYRTDSGGRQLCECRSAEETLPAPPPQATLPPASCRDMSSCRKKCPHGFRRDASGCKRCKCRKCRRLKGCSLGCPLAVNERGCRVCRCRQGSTTLPTPTPTPIPTPTPTSTETPLIHRLSCVTTDGEVHVPGTSWNDGCRQCYCHEGTEMCSMIACPVPACEHPEIGPGHCCPSCPDEHPAASRHVSLTVCLSAGGGTYLEGQTWQLDPCTLCLCRGGRVLCHHPVCPPAACPLPQRRPGDCCATCPGRSPTGGSTEPPADGSSGGRACTAGPGPSWPDGAAWRRSACVSCRCRDGATRCYHQRCPALDCDRPVLSKGRCCPHCVQRATDGSCMHSNGTRVASGQSWRVDACTSCVCRAGLLSCAQKVCSGGCRGPPPPGHCCPVCKDESLSDKRGKYPFLNGTSKVAHRTRVSAPEPPAPTTRPGPAETDGSHSSLLYILLPIAGVLTLLAAVAIIAIFCVVRRRSGFSPKQPPPAPAEEEKRPLNDPPAVDFTRLGGLSPLQGRRPPEPTISVIRHA